MADRKPRTKDVQLAVRLPKGLLQRIDAQCRRMEDERPGLGVTRSAVVRVLVEQALELAESASEPRHGEVIEGTAA